MTTRAYRLTKHTNNNVIEFKARAGAYALLQHHGDQYTIIIMSAQETIELYNAITEEMQKPMFERR